MYPLWKLALRILALTVVLLAAAAGLLVRSLYRDAPPPVAPEIVLQIGPGRIDRVSAVAWSPDGKFLASGGADSTLSVWDASTGTRLRTFSDHSFSVRAVAWSPDGTILAAGSEDGTIRLWDSASGFLLRTFDRHHSKVWSVAWSPDGRTLASGHEDKTLKLWNISSGGMRTLWGHKDRVWSVAWSPDGRTLASGSDDHTLKFWDAASGRLLRTRSNDSGRILSVAWSPDGRTLATGNGDNTLDLWDTASGKVLSTLRGHVGPVLSVAWSPDGKTLASGSEDMTLKLWDPSSGGEALRTLSDHSAFVLSVAWSPDGKTLASGSGDGSAALWQSTGTLEWFFVAVHEDLWLTYHPTKLFYTASPEGDRLAAVRFASQTSPVYPLAYYRAELKQSALSHESSQAPPSIQPRPLRLAWDHFEDKGAWLTVCTILYGMGFALALVIVHGQNPMSLAHRFFSSVGATRIQQLDRNLLSFTPASGGRKAYALLWQEESPRLPRSFPRATGASDESNSVYVLYKGQVPDGVRAPLRERLPCHILPISERRIATALSQRRGQALLQEVDERFSTRIDLYDEAEPVEDPSWFFGREDVLQRLVTALAQGQNVGLRSLHKMGKTSLIHQLRNQAQGVPAVHMDCRAAGWTVEGYFQSIIDSLHAEFHRLRIPLPTTRKKVSSAADFLEEVLLLHDRWSRTGHFLLFLDTLDQLFADQHRESSAQLLAERRRLLHPLRALSQEHHCLAIMTISHRNDVSWPSSRNSSSREPPPFTPFQELFLGALTPTETRAMVERLGAWRDIRWESEALDELHGLCGGHPFLTRLLASEACEGGGRHHVTLDQVQSAAQAILSHFPEHRIGEYYKEAIWDTSRDDERLALQLIAGEDAGLQEALLPRQLGAALARIEHYGLVQRGEGRLLITASLLRRWILQNTPIPDVQRIQTVQ